MKEMKNWEVYELHLASAAEARDANHRAETCQRECMQLHAILNWIKRQEWFNKEDYDRVIKAITYD